MFKIKDSLQLISILNFLFKNFQNPAFEVKANKNKFFFAVVSWNAISENG